MDRSEAFLFRGANCETIAKPCSVLSTGTCAWSLPVSSPWICHLCIGPRVRYPPNAVTLVLYPCWKYLMLHKWFLYLIFCFMQLNSFITVSSKGYIYVSHFRALKTIVKEFKKPFREGCLDGHLPLHAACAPLRLGRCCFVDRVSEDKSSMYNVLL